ncbi:MAG: ABC transporter ATP-binding protein [Clostridia bacterium]|nr:ABC transporter ATP-binding protein [Clostridia bacterium]
MINVSNVTKTFGEFKALDELSLNVKKGCVYGLIGPNGAGKTTIIKNLCGIYRPDCGEITIDGEAVYENTDIKQRLIYISDELFFYSSYSIRAAAKMYSQIYPEWSWSRYEKLKEIFKIDEKRKIRRLSKGMQKQVAFWLGICTRPNVMILDEPVDGLDPVMRKNVWSLVLSDVAENGTTVLISSHNLRELEDVCDHVGIMFGGKVVLQKSLDDVKGNIHKIQTAFADGFPKGLEENIQILHSSAFGSVVTLIAKGDSEQILQSIKKYNPIICDILPLTLEEVFIYELGGLGYELENIIL